MESQEHRRITGTEAQLVQPDKDAAQIAAAMVSTWQAIEAALCPIIGLGGVIALYKRTFYLTVPEHAWLAAAVPDGVPATLDLSALQTLVAQQSNAAAAAGSAALFRTFYALLTSLIGASLTERLLRSVWAPPFSGPPAQDTSP